MTKVVGWNGKGWVEIFLSAYGLRNYEQNCISLNIKKIEITCCSMFFLWSFRYFGGGPVEVPPPFRNFYARTLGRGKK